MMERALVEELADRYGVQDQTIRRWSRQFPGWEADEAPPPGTRARAQWEAALKRARHPDMTDEDYNDAVARGWDPDSGGPPPEKKLSPIETYPGHWSLVQEVVTEHKIRTGAELRKHLAKHDVHMSRQAVHDGVRRYQIKFYAEGA